MLLLLVCVALLVGHVAAHVEISEDDKLLASDGGALDKFGTSVSISHDGTHAVVGAIGWDAGSSTDAGAAYFYNRTGTSTWTQQHKHGANEAGGQFGNAVAMSGDGRVAVVGNWLAKGSCSGAQAGAAAVFLRKASGWSKADDIHGACTTTDPGAGDKFGVSVAVSGDGEYVLAGAYGDDDSATDSGAAYVFRAAALGTNSPTWSQQAKLKADDPDYKDKLGVSVALSADAVFAVVGAYGDDEKGTDSGAAYLFKRSGTVWSQLAKLTAGDAAGAGDQFGYSVSVAAVGNSAYVAVGAWLANGRYTGTDTGKVYVFKVAGDTGAPNLRAVYMGNNDYDKFGVSVSLSSNATRLVIGAFGSDDKGKDSGKVYVVERGILVSWPDLVDPEAWSPYANGFTPADGAAYDEFGLSVAVSGDGNYAIFGAHEDDDKGSRSGSAYACSVNWSLIP